MGRTVTEDPSVAAMHAAESEDHAAVSALHALESERKAKDYADAANLAVGTVASGGMMTANVFIFQRSTLNVAPPLPSDDITFTFSDGSINYLTNGWTKELPLSTEGDYLFVTYAAVIAANGSAFVVVSPSKWNEPQLMAASSSGATTTAYWMTRSAGVIQKDTDDRYTPEAITFRSLSITGTDPIMDYSARFKIDVTYDGVSFINTYISATDEPNISYTIPAAIKAVRVRMYQAGDTSTLLQEELIPVVLDGISYVVKIESTNGDIFRVGQASSTTLIAHVFRNGTEVTATIPSSNFRWRRVSFVNPQYPHDDQTWNNDYATGYKQVIITTENIDSRATFFCDILKN